MPLFSNLVGFLSALFCLLGAFSLGSQITKIVWDKHTSFHFSFVVGLGIVYCSVFFLFPVPFIYIGWLLVAVFFLSIVTSAPKIIKFGEKAFATNRWLWLLVLLLLGPLVFRVLSPPTSFDGMSFYIPNVIWISQNGLSFNDHLPQYSTMPLLTEFYFAINYKLGGIQAIRFSDVLFSLLLLDVLFKIGKSFNNKFFSTLFIAVNLIAPGCIIYVFGTGKVDTLGFYLAALGSYNLFCKWHPMRAFFYFSVALGVKYTLWVVLLGPLAGLAIVVLLKTFFPWQRKVWVLCLPLLFAGPVLVKNYFQVNNPLAPLLLNGKETRYVGSHGELPKSKVTEISSKALGGLSIGKDLKLPIPNLNTLGIFFFVFFLCLFIFLKKDRAFLRDILFLSLFVVFWLCLFGKTAQPLRFYWPIFLVSIMLGFKWISVMLSRKTFSSRGWFYELCVVLVWIVLGGFFWAKHGNWLPIYIASQSLSMPEWYHKYNRNHYAISAAIAKDNIPIHTICFEERVALGFFSLEDWKYIPDPQAFVERKSCSPEKQCKLISKGRESKLDSSKEKVIYQYGEFVLLQKHTARY